MSKVIPPVPSAGATLENAAAERPQTSDREAAAERRCLVTGEVSPRVTLIRFVASPDNHVLPDLAEKLPGRGFWLSAHPAAITDAARQNRFSKAAGAKLQCAPDLAVQVALLLRRDLQQKLGLAKRAGVIVVGFNQVEPELARGSLRALFVASDAGTDGSAKLERLNPTLPCWRLLSSVEQGQALGHDQLVYLGLRFHALTSRILTAATRFSAFATQENVAPTPPLAQIGASSATGLPGVAGAVAPPLTPEGNGKSTDGQT